MESFQYEIMVVNPILILLKITLVVEQTIVLQTIQDKIIPKLINNGPANSEYMGDENQINSK